MANRVFTPGSITFQGLLEPSGNSLLRPVSIPNTAWACGANSDISYTNRCAIRFTAPGDSVFMAGLSEIAGLTDNSYTYIDYAIFIYFNEVRIYESNVGVDKEVGVSLWATVEPEDILEIEYTSEAIHYKKNSVTFRTVFVSTDRTFYFDCASYSSESSRYVLHNIQFGQYDINTITVEGNKLAPDTYIELFDIDLSLISSESPIHLTNSPTGSASTHILWRGESYKPFPLELTGVDSRGDGTAPNRPMLALSNADKYLLAFVISYGNLIGAIVRRWRTFYKYTDAGTEANAIMHYPIEEWTIIRKVAQSKNALQFELANPLDRPGLRLPRKQILRDQGFPGVAKVRLR